MEEMQKRNSRRFLRNVITPEGFAVFISYICRHLVGFSDRPWPAGYEIELADCEALGYRPCSPGESSHGKRQQYGTWDSRVTVPQLTRIQVQCQLSDDYDGQLYIPGFLRRETERTNLPQQWNDHCHCQAHQSQDRSLRGTAL